MIEGSEFSSGKNSELDTNYSDFLTFNSYLIIDLSMVVLRMFGLRFNLGNFPLMDFSMLAVENKFILFL